MRIGIIGAGAIGGTLTRRLAALGHHVSVANSRGPESLAELAAETGAKPVSVAEAARNGEVVIVTIPERNIPKLPRDLFAATPDTVVIVDTGNYYPQQRDGRIEAIEAGTTESRWVAQQLNRPVTRPSTIFMLNTCWSWVSLKAPRDALRCRWQAMIMKLKPS